jgi:hypothetical protein
MHKRILGHWAGLSVAIVVLCLFLWPASAMATSITTYNFTGTTSIVSINSINGTYGLDLSTDSVAGPWSFSIPRQPLKSTFHSISSTDPGAFGTLIESENLFGLPSGFDILQFSSKLGSVQFIVSDPQNAGNITLRLNPRLKGGFPVLSQYSRFAFTSGSSTPVAVTPEPSSLLLFGTGLLGLAPFVRRRFARH